MSKRFGLTTCLLALLMAVSAQQKLNYAEVDKKSYELYTQQKWAELIDFADEARSNGIDYFYLQARTGIAFYNLKKYRKASEFLLKAWKNDQSFEWLQEYLYYSLIYGGRSAEAIKYAQNFSGNMQQKIGYKSKKLTKIALEGGYSFPDFEELMQSNLYEMANVGDDYGEAFFLKNYHFESFDLSHRISPAISINHNITFMGINREEQVYWGELYTFPLKHKQFQYFVNPVFIAGKKWYVSMSANLISGDYSYHAGGAYQSEKYFYQGTVYFRDLIFSASTWFHYRNFSPGVEIDYGNFNNEGFGQYSAWLTFYPLSNANLYITPRVFFKKENGFGYNTFGISGGAQLGPVHFYGQYLNGDMKNFIEPGGYVVSNFPGMSEQKLMGSLYFPAGKKYQFVVRYINQDIIEEYKVYTSGVLNNSLEYKYIKHTLTAGISWNF